MALSRNGHSHLPIISMLLLTMSLVTHRAGAADAPTAPPTLLENQALRVYVTAGGQATLTEIYAKKLNVGARQCAATESAPAGRRTVSTGTAWTWANGIISR